MSANLNKANVADNYRRSIYANIRGLWRGVGDLMWFMNNMNSSIYRGFVNAWYAGAAECGISPSELSGAERLRLQEEIYKEYAYIINFADEIVRNSRANGGKLTPLLRRGDLWANRFDGIRSVAMSYACEDEKLKWVWNPSKEHCADCMNLNGRVYRASIWRKYQIEPRMRSLACHGYQCGCEFVPTSEPATPGRPPNIGGI